MGEIYCDLGEFNDGVIAFDEGTCMIDRFINLSEKSILQYSSLGSGLTNHMRGHAQLKISPPQNNHANWFNNQGISCSILSPDTNGWQKGKVKINIQVTVEFYPDDPASFLTSCSPCEESPESPLDDLRSLEDQV